MPNPKRMAMKYTILILLALAACKSYPINEKSAKAVEDLQGIQKDTEESDAETEWVNKLVDESTATPSQKAAIKEKTGAIKQNNQEIRVKAKSAEDTVKEQSQTISKQAATILRLEWYETVFWSVVAGLGVAVVGFGLYKCLF